MLRSSGASRLGGLCTQGHGRCTGSFELGVPEHGGERLALRFVLEKLHLPIAPTAPKSRVLNRPESLPAETNTLKQADSFESFSLPMKKSLKTFID